MPQPIVNLRVVPNSGNRKLGAGVAATYRPVGITCPPSCPLLDNICYARRGNVRIWAEGSRGLSSQLDRMAGAPLIRWEVSGDSFRDNGKLDRRYVRAKLSFHRRYPMSHGWGYTHDADTWHDAGYGPDSWPENFVTLASCESESEAKRLQSLGWRTARIVASKKAKLLPGEVICPNDLDKRVTCSLCRECPSGNSNIVFLKKG